MTKRLIPAAAVSLAAAAIFTSSASAAAATDAQPSSNWAGYATTGAQFSKVSGTWVQPEANCDSGAGVAAFWVGIGGVTGAQALEQAGTEVDCSSGSPEYTTRYELVPDAPVTTDLEVKPGDTVSTTVGVDGNQVSVAMTNKTTGKSFNKTLEMDNPDTSSAEWIAEAPSACQGSLDNCHTLPLADFGSVKFSDASATADGHTGSIGDSAWSATPMQLSPSASNGFAGGQLGTSGGDTGSAATASALPSTLDGDGSAFSVDWAASDDTQSSGGGGTAPQTGDGSGSVDPYGYGDGSGSVDPYGYGDGS